MACIRSWNPAKANAAIWGSTIYPVPTCAVLPDIHLEMSTATEYTWQSCPSRYCVHWYPTAAAPKPILHKYNLPSQPINLSCTKYSYAGDVAAVAVTSAPYPEAHVNYWNCSIAARSLPRRRHSGPAVPGERLNGKAKACYEQASWINTVLSTLPHNHHRRPEGLFFCLHLLFPFLPKPATNGQLACVQCMYPDSLASRAHR